MAILSHQWDHTQEVGRTKTDPLTILSSSTTLYQSKQLLVENHISVLKQSLFLFPLIEALRFTGCLALRPAGARAVTGAQSGAQYDPLRYWGKVSPDRGHQRGQEFSSLPGTEHWKLEDKDAA